MDEEVALLQDPRVSGVAGLCWRKGGGIGNTETPKGLPLYENTKTRKMETGKKQKKKILAKPHPYQSNDGNLACSRVVADHGPTRLTTDMELLRCGLHRMGQGI
jgi:hypothetical protein